MCIRDRYLRILAAALCLTVLVLAGALLLWSWRMLSPYDRIVNRLMGAAGTTGPRDVYKRQLWG